MSAPFRALAGMFRNKLQGLSNLRKAAMAVDVPGMSARPLKAQIEGLEERKLMTTLVGGDIFEYRQADGQTVRIVLRGNVVAEAIGGSIDDLNSTPNNQLVRINDLPGRFYASAIGRTNTDVLGGVGGADGVELLTPVSIVDPINNGGSFAYDQEEGNESINLQAIATDSQQNIYSFNVVDIPAAGGVGGDRRIVQLLQISPTTQTATVIAELSTAIATAGTFGRPSGINAITAADIDPINGRLWFVAQGFIVTATTDEAGNVTETVTDNPVVQLFSVSLANPTAIPPSIRAVPGNFGATDDTGDIDSVVPGIVWDQTSPSTAQLRALVSGDESQRLVNLNVDVNSLQGNTGQFQNAVTISFRGEDVTGLTGIALVQDAPGAADQFIHATQGGDGGGDSPSLFRIDRLTGNSENLGPLPDPDDADPDTDGIQRGASITGLSYDPNRLNPFTGELGVLVGVDSEADDVVLIDDRNRVPESNLFQLVITQSDETAEIIIGVVPDDDPEDSEDDAPSERPMTPFEGSAGALRVNNAGSGDSPIVVTIPTGTGEVYLGVRSVDVEDTDDDEGDIPLLFGQLAQQLGVVGAGRVNAGIVSTASLLMALEGQTTLAERLAGQNFDLITGISVSSSGQIVAIDSDLVDENGQPITADQLGLVDPVTGKIVPGSPRAIFSSTLGTAIRGLQALEFADTDNNPATPEELLAVFASQVTGSTSDGGSLGINLDNLILSLAVTPDGNTAFILAQDGTNATQARLYRSDRDATTRRFGTVTDLGVVRDSNGNTITALRTLGVAPSGQVLTVGFNRDNPAPVQSTGGTYNAGNLSTLDLAVATDGQTYALVSEGSGFAIYQIGRDPSTGAVTPDIPDTQAQTALLPDGFRRLGTVAAGTSAVQRLNSVTADPSNPNNLFGIGASSTSLLPVNSLGEVSVGAAPSTSDFIYRGLTSSADGQLFAVTSNGSVLQLRQISLTPQGGTVAGGAAVVGGNTNYIRFDANTGTGAGPTTAILGIRATDARPGDATGIYAIGTGADQIAPTTAVLGDLGGLPVSRLVFRGVNPGYHTDNVVFNINGESFQSFRLGTATRDTATGALFGANPARSLQVERVGSGSAGNSFVANQIIDASALGVIGGVFHTSGFNYDAPVPNARLAGNLGQAFGSDQVTNESNIRAISARPATLGQLDEIYAAVFNGSGTDIYRLLRNATTGAIASFTKVNSGTLGLRDPTQIDPSTGQPQQINRVYSLAFDPNNANRILFVGDVGNTSNPIFKLYTLDVATNGTVTVNTGADAPRTITGPGFSPLNVIKAIAIRPSDNAVFVVQDGDGVVIGLDNTLVPNSQLFQLTLGAGTATAVDFGAINGITLNTALTTTPIPTVNSDVRGLDFHTLADGREMLIALDIGLPNQADSRLFRIDFNNTEGFANPLVAPGGVLGTVTGVNGNVQVAAGLQITFAGRVTEGTNTFTIDQYGRSYSIAPITNSGLPNTLLVSANEVYTYDTLFDNRDSDADGFGSLATGGPSELVSEGPITNPDGTAFLDSIDHLLANDGGNFLGVTAQRFSNSLRSVPAGVTPVERLISLSDGGAGRTAGFVITALGGGSALSSGTIQIVGSTTETVRIRGLTFAADGSLLALQSNPVDGVFPDANPNNDITSLLSLDINGGTTVAATRITDPADTVMTTAPGGLATDSSGRVYTPDRNTLAGQLVTRLLVGVSNQSIFRIDQVTGLATKIGDVADTAEFLQQPVLDQFSALAWRDANTLYSVQNDVSEGNVNRLVIFENVPQSSTTNPITFRRVNAGVSSGLISTNGTTSLSITAMDFTIDGRLVGLDSSNNAQVQINFDESAGSLGPANSVFVSALGAAADLNGLTLGGGVLPAFSGRFLSIQGGGAAPDLLLSSQNNIALFAIDRNSGQATSRGIITLAGLGVSDSNFVVAIAHDRPATPTEGNIYAVVQDLLGNQRLFVVNPNTGVSQDLGAIVIEGVAANITALSVTLAGDLIGLHNPTGSTNSRLARINLTTPGTSTFVAGSLPGAVRDDLVGLATDPSGRFLSLSTQGSAADQLFITPTQFFSFGSTSSAVVSGGALLTGSATFGGTPVTTAVLDSLVASDFNNLSQFYAVRRVPNILNNGQVGTPPTVDQLVRIDLGTGAVQSFGTIFVNATPSSPAQVLEMAFNAAGNLQLTDLSDANGPRVISIAFDSGGNPVAQSVGQATVLSPGGTLDANIVGYASDSAGNYFGVNIASNPDSMSIDSDGIFLPTGTAVIVQTNPVLGRLLRDSTGAFTGAFEQIGTITLNGTPLGSIVAMSYNATRGLLVVDNNSVLYRIDPATGQVIQTLGTITDLATGQAIQIGSMDFDNQGRLIIQDLTNSRAVELNFTTLQVGGPGTFTSVTGSLSATVGAISNDPPRNRFIVADNATSSNPIPGEAISPESATISQFITTGGTGGRQDISRIFVGGTVTGLVSLGGSIDQFYAGFLATGYAQGLFDETLTPDSDTAIGDFTENFFIDGNANQIITTASVGTTNSGIFDRDNISYFTGFEAVINGRLGEFRVLSGDFPGLLRVLGQSIATTLRVYDVPETPSLAFSDGDIVSRRRPLALGGLTAATRELENTFENNDDTVGDAFERGELNTTFTSNDTFIGSQRLGTLANPNGTNSRGATVVGVLKDGGTGVDRIDYYSVGLLAGQTIGLNLSDLRFTLDQDNIGDDDFDSDDLGFGRFDPVFFSLGIFDPDGRLIFTTYNDIGGTSSSFQFTADRPGEYRIAIGFLGDYNFNGVADGIDDVVYTTADSSRQYYAFDVLDLGNVTLGGLIVNGNIANVGAGNAGVSTNDFTAAQIVVSTGDFGSAQANAIVSDNSVNSFRVSSSDNQGGNLRSILAATIGTLDGSGGADEGTISTVSRGVGISVPLGSVGLIRTTSAVGALILNPFANLATSALTTGATSPNTLVNPVGGSYQMIDAAGVFAGNIYANVGIGVIRALTADVNTVQRYVANADNQGQDGFIDLIDIAGNLGTLPSGGPQISTNVGGNVKYIRVGGTLFQDKAFGTGGDIPTFQGPGLSSGGGVTLGAGQGFNFTDDSGSSIVFGFDPRFLVRNPNFNSSDPLSSEFLSPTIRYRAYPIRSGGSVLVDMLVQGSGLTINSIGRTGSVSSAEISLLTIDATGITLPVIPLTDRSISGSTLLIEGTAAVNIQDLDVRFVPNADIRNKTRGTHAIIRGDTVNSIEIEGSLGAEYSKASFNNNSRMVLEPAEVLNNELPFSLARIGAVLGATTQILVGGQIGNIIGSGDILTVTANNNGGNDPALFEGIVGNVFTLGNLGTVTAGEGIASSGSGFFYQAGVFAIGSIGFVRSSGDIRGTVASLTSIGEVTTASSIIDANIGVYAGLLPGDFINSGFEFTGFVIGERVPDSAQNPVFEITLIRAANGIIGTTVQAFDIDRVEANGFGLISSRILSTSEGTIGSVVGSGYGIRDTVIGGGANVGNITANGRGNSIPTGVFSPSVLQSAFRTFDEFSGRILSISTDLYQALGTSPALQEIVGVTESGVIEDVSARGTGSLGTIRGFQIRGSFPDDSTTTNFFGLPAGRTNLNFGNNISEIRTDSTINGLSVITGRLGKFTPAGDVNNLNLTVSGRIGAIRIAGNLAGGSNIASIGPSAAIDSLRVDGNFFGSLLSQGRIGTIDVRGNIGILNDNGQPILDSNGNRVGLITIDPVGDLRGGLALTRLRVGGSLIQGSLVIGRSDKPANVGTIEVAGSFGSVGDTLVINGSLKSLKVGTNRSTTAVFNMALTVTGNVGTIDVQGRINGGLQIGGSLQSLKVTNDNPNDLAILNGLVSVGGSTRSVLLTGGNLTSTFTSFGDIGKFDIRTGSISQSGSVVVSNGSLKSLQIRGGSVVGNISVARRIDSLQVDALGDDIDPRLTISAQSAGRIRVAGEIFSDVTVSIAGRLDSLDVGGNVDAGAVLTAGGGFGKVTVRGQNNGTFSPALA